jgi:predicted secreted protein
MGARHSITSTDDGSTIEVRVGDDIEIELPGLGTAGYEWHLGALADGIEMGTPRDYASARSGAVGGSAPFVVALRVAGPVDGEVTVKQYRRWEGESRARRSFRIRVRATGG